MRLEATLARDDLRNVLADAAPLKVRLGQKGELLLGEPSEVALVPGRGLRLVCAAQLSWDLLGISVPVTLNSLVVLVEPLVEKRDDADVLVFKLQIESADLAMVPSLIGDRVTEHVNKELLSRHVELSWMFSKTLSHVFSLPATLKNVASIGLKVFASSLTITSDAVVFAVSFRANVGRRVDPATPNGDGPRTSR
jgi:hypothetical protein